MTEAAPERPHPPSIAPPATRNLQPAPGRRLRPLGATLQVALLGPLIVGVLHGWAVGHRLHLFNRALDEPRTVSLATLRVEDHRVHSYAIVYFVVTLVVIPLFLIWFHQARVSAERHNQDVLRFGRGWAIGAWFTPFISLWRPYQMATDILCASALPIGARDWDRRGLPVVRLWWGLFLLTELVTRSATFGSFDSPTAFRRSAYFDIAGDIVNVLAAVAAIVVVERITVVNDRRRDELLGTAGAATAWAG